MELEIDLGPSHATVLFGRRAAARQRSIKLAFQDGGSAEFDFTIEPGRIVIDGLERANIDPGHRVGPLAAETADFLDIVDGLQEMDSSPQFAARCLGSVALAETVREQLIEAEANAVSVRLAQGHSIHDADISAWIVDNIAPLLKDEGIRIASADRQRIDQIVEAFQQAVDEERSCVPASLPAGTSRAIISIIKGSRFFGILINRLSNMP